MIPKFITIKNTLHNVPWTINTNQIRFIRPIENDMIEIVLKTDNVSDIKSVKTKISFNKINEIIGARCLFDLY